MIEEEILSIIDDAEFCAIYIESNVENGIWEVFFIAHNGTEWIQSAWDDGYRIALEKPMFRDNWKRIICNFRFPDDIVVDLGTRMIFHATSAYLFIYCHDRLRRFAVYNPSTTVYGDSDDRYIRQIRRMTGYIRRNYLWIQLFQRKKSS